MKREKLGSCILKICLCNQQSYKSGKSKRYYENQRQTGTYPSADCSRILWNLYYILKYKISAIPGIIKSLKWNFDCIITILTKIEEGYEIHLFQSKSL